MIKSTKILQSIFLVFFMLIIGFTCVSIAQDLSSDDLWGSNPTNLQQSLYNLVESFGSSGIFGAEQLAKNSGIKMINGKVKVIVGLEPGEDPLDVIPDLAKAGAIIQGYYWNLIQILAPVESLKDMGAVKGVDYIRLPLYANPEDVVSQGVEVTRAYEYVSKGFRGQNVKIAVLDIGFEGYEDLLGSELPENVIAKSFYNDINGNGDITGDGLVHGTACAEIVHDMAPDAQLYLVNISSELEFVYAVDWLIDQGVNIITHSVGWLPGPFDGTGLICDVINRAFRSGILWVNSAGNYAMRHYEGKFTDTDGDNWHEYSPLDETVNIYVRAGRLINAILSWDAWPITNEDYDLYILDENYIPIAWSKYNQKDLGLEPVEGIEITAPKTGYYYIAIKKIWTQRNHHLELYSFSNNFLDNNVPSSSLNDNSTTEAGFIVGATYWADDSLEYYSSRGPTNDGRIKPDISAPDGVNSATYGPGGFYGTSASTPHVAGAAAIIKSMYPDISPAQIRILLEGMAIDLGDPGKDNLYGSGRLNFEQPGLHSVCYDLLSHEMTLEFGFPVMANNICFDGIGMELDDSGKWDFQLSDGLGLKGENKTPRILKIDLNRANATTINIAVAQLMNHKKVELLLKEGAFTYQFGYKAPPIQGRDNFKIKMLAGEFNLGKIGDVNGDDMLTAYDAGLIMKASAKGIESLPISKATQEVDRWIEAGTGRKCNIGKDMADWDRDGQVTSSDASSLLKWIVSNNASKSSPGLARMDDIPGKCSLMQNFPNPFNPETWIPYQLSEPADVTIKIYNMRGQIVRTLNLGMKSAGFYTDKLKAAYWDGKNESGEKVASGIYFYSIQAGDFTDMKKMIIRE